MANLTNSWKLIEKIEWMRSVIVQATAPSNPSTWDLWFDSTSTSKMLKIYNWTTWEIVWPEMESVTQAEYDAMSAAEKNNGKYYLITDSSGSVIINWWSISWTLSDQTDLQNALDWKQDSLTAGRNIDLSSDIVNLKLIEVEVATAYGTAAKVWTTTAGNYTPTKWDLLLVNFVNGSNVNNPTLNIDGSGAKNIKTDYTNATTNTMTLWATANSNIKILMYYDGTYYKTRSTANTIPSSMTAAEITAGTWILSRTITPANLKTAIQTWENVHSVNSQTWDVVLSIPTSASDVWALADTTKYWASLVLSIDSSTYVITATLKDQDGNTLGTSQTIDLPLESVVVSGSYDSTNKKVILTLKDGSTIDFSVADLISWLQTEITSSNKLNADYVDDTSSTNKFVTASDKSAWNWKQDALTAWSNITISWTTISSTDTTYTAGTGIDITNDEISVDNTVAMATDVNTKTFYLSSTNDLTNAQAAYDWIQLGNEAIIKYNNVAYLRRHDNPNVYLFRAIPQILQADSTVIWTDSINYMNIQLLMNGSTVSSIIFTNNSSRYINANRDYSTPYTPQYDGSPATKKYVDDSIGWINDVKQSASAPSSPTEWMVWYDTTNDVLKVYDGSNWNEVGSWETYNAWDGIEIWDDYSAMQWPAPTGYHVPSKDEWVALCGILTSTFSLANTGATMKTYLLMPFAGYRIYSSAGVNTQGSYGTYWSSTRYNSNDAYRLYFDSTALGPQGAGRRASGFSVRCFKDSPVVPDSSWTTLYDGSTVATWAWIFHNSSLWLISISGDWTTWYTIQDKNLGATSTDITSTDSYGYYYQWWNNYWFPTTWSVTTSSTKVDASGYWPGNYYSSGTFIIGSSDWSSVQNDNLWWWVTWVVNNAISNTGVLSVNGQTGDVTIAVPDNTIGISWNVDINDLWPNWLYYTSWAVTLAVWWSETLSFPKWTLLILYEWDWDNRELTSFGYVHTTEEDSAIQCWIIDPTPEWWAAKIVDFSMYSIDPENFLSKYNRDAYTPTNDYNPATKKYVDDSVITKIFTLSWTWASAAVLAEAQAIYDWYIAWKEPIIDYDSKRRHLTRMDTTYVYFSVDYVRSSDYRYAKSLKFVLSSWSVTNVQLFEKAITIATAVPSSWNTNTIYFVK